MAKHWVQALKAFRIDTTLYQPGDWLQVNRLAMRKLMEEGRVETPMEIVAETFDLSGCGIFQRGEAPALKDCWIPITSEGDNWLPYDRTVIWLPGTKAFTMARVALGLSYIEAGDDYNSWEMAAALASEAKTVGQFGSEDEQQKTLKLLGDLRLPVYQTDMVWARRTPATEAMVAAWRAEVESGADEIHAFVRALYTHSVRLTTLPPQWLSGHRPSRG